MLYHGVVFPVNEPVITGLVPENTEFCRRIVFHLVVVAVQMIRGDVHYDGDVGLEIIHVLELEAGELYHVVIMVGACHLIGEAASHVAGESHIQPCLLEDVVGKQGSGGFAVAPRDAHHFCVGVSRCELNFGNDGNPFLHDFTDNRGAGRYSGAFHHYVGFEDTLLCVVSGLVFDSFGVEYFAVMVADVSHVA